MIVQLHQFMKNSLLSLLRKGVLSDRRSSAYFLTVVLVIAVAAFLRFYQLSRVPFGFHNDEVMNGYVGRFILENGVDLYGNKWPILYFDNFGDYPNVIPMYISGATTYLLGVNEFAVRFPIALLGTATVVLVMILSNILFLSKKASIITGLALAVMPWHVVLSRSTAEGIIATFFYVVGIIFIIQALTRKKIATLFLAVTSLLFTYFLYPGFRVFVPLSLLPVILLAPNRHWKKISLFLTVTFFFFTFIISQTTWGKGRFNQTSLFTFNGTIAGRSLNYSIGLGSGKILQARVFYNRYVLALRELLRQYSSYFSPDFLVGTGGKPERYKVFEHGELYWSFLLIIFSSSIKQFVTPSKTVPTTILFKANRGKYFLWFMWILAVAAIPAALTLEDVPNVHRTLVSSVFWAILFACCWQFLYSSSQTWSKVLSMLFVFSLLAESIYFAQDYFSLHSLAATPYRSDEQHALAYWLKEHREEYHTVYAPYAQTVDLHYLFVTQNFSPELVGHFSSGMDLDEVDNIKFIAQSETCPSQLFYPSDLLGNIVIDRSECPSPPGYKVVDLIKHLDATEGYTIRTASSSTSTFQE